MVGAVGCSDAASPRAQLVVEVDTNVPLSEQLDEIPDLSPDASVDTLRVDLLGADNQLLASSLFVAPSPADWPLSFGVTPTPGSSLVRIRLRLFRGKLAPSGTIFEQATLDPAPSIVVDRVLELQHPDSGVRSVHVLLSGDCWGRPPSFGPDGTTCVDADTLQGSFRDGISDEAGGATQAGTWELAEYLPCPSQGSPDRICVPGGFMLLGDSAVAGVEDGFSLLESLPMRAVRLQPFEMDRTEFSVGRLRELLAAGYAGELPKTAASKSGCTFLGPSDAMNDALPVNCVSWQAARALCQASGGDLPSEAQWEWVARGRGRRWFFPWGDQIPTCCSAALDRPNTGKSIATCQGPPLDPVDNVEACDGPTDSSLDGARGLAGNVSEMTLDSALPLTHPCWAAPGILHDPVCEDASEPARVLRGGSTGDGMALCTTALRRVTFEVGGTAEGFRCVRPLP